MCAYVSMWSNQMESNLPWSTPNLRQSQLCACVCVYALSLSRSCSRSHSLFRLVDTCSEALDEWVPMMEALRRCVFIFFWLSLCLNGSVTKSDSNYCNKRKQQSMTFTAIIDGFNRILGCHMPHVQMANFIQLAAHPTPSPIPPLPPLSREHASSELVFLWHTSLFELIFLCKCGYDFLLSTRLECNIICLTRWIPQSTAGCSSWNGSCNLK